MERKHSREGFAMLVLDTAPWILFFVSCYCLGNLFSGYLFIIVFSKFCKFSRRVIFIHSGYFLSPQIYYYFLQKKSWSTDVIFLSTKLNVLYVNDSKIYILQYLVSQFKWWLKEICRLYTKVHRLQGQFENAGFIWWCCRVKSLFCTS